MPPFPQRLASRRSSSASRLILSRFPGEGLCFPDRARLPSRLYPMPLTKMEHYLVLTDDMEATKEFYARALGMHVGFRPPLEFPGYWMYVGDTPCIHIAEWRSYTDHSLRKGIPVSERGAGTG